MAAATSIVYHQFTNARPHIHVCHHKIMSGCMGAYLECSTPSADEIRRFGIDWQKPSDHSCPVKESEIDDQGNVSGLCLLCKLMVKHVTSRETHKEYCDHGVFCLDPEQWGKPKGYEPTEDEKWRWKYVHTCYEMTTAEDLRVTRGLPNCEEDRARFRSIRCGLCDGAT